jgi:cell division protein FtsI/penicillin-binding protein 2
MIYDPNTKAYKIFKPQVVDRIFSSWTSEKIKEALYKVIAEWDLPMLAITGYTLWWKTWTSQIAFKWKYQRWAWWTNWSFVWIVTKDDLKYVIAIQVRRPRTCQWWVCSAWKIFKDIAQYIIDSWKVTR